MADYPNYHTLNVLWLYVYILWVYYYQFGNHPHWLNSSQIVHIRVNSLLKVPQLWSGRFWSIPEPNFVECKRVKSLVTVWKARILMLIRFCWRNSRQAYWGVNGFPFGPVLILMKLSIGKFQIEMISCLAFLFVVVSGSKGPVDWFESRVSIFSPKVQISTDN